MAFCHVGSTEFRHSETRAVFKPNCYHVCIQVFLIVYVCWNHAILILFLVCVNNLPLSRTSTCADIFADDTTIGTSSNSIDTLVETLTTDLQNVLSWCNSNNMSLNVSKTKLMYISYRHKQQTIANCDHDISICDNKIQISSVEKLLGGYHIIVI